MKCKLENCENEVSPNKNGCVKLFCSLSCKNKYNVNRFRWKLRIKATAYKGGKCQICGYNKNITSLEFHHREPEQKSFNISHPHTRSWDKLKEEVDKCDLLCANCHQEAEHKKKSSHKEFIDELLKEFNVCQT